MSELIPLSLRRPVHAAAHQEVSQALPVQRRELQRAEGADQLHPHRGVQQEQALRQHKVHEGDHLERIHNKASKIYILNSGYFIHQLIMLINDQIVMSEIIEDGVGCSFAEVAGQAQAKQALQECVILPSLR